MPRNTETIRKPFVLDDQQWSPMNARLLDQFLEDVTRNSVVIRHGNYTGIGRSQDIAVPDLPQPPILLVLQPASGGTPLVTMVQAGDVTLWTRNGFTLSGTSGYNTSSVSYLYVVLA